MPRTKQTARKSTGGKPPNVRSLAANSARTTRAARAAAATVTTTSANLVLWATAISKNDKQTLYKWHKTPAGKKAAEDWQDKYAEDLDYVNNERAAVKARVSTYTLVL